MRQAAHSMNDVQELAAGVEKLEAAIAVYGATADRPQTLCQCTSCLRCDTFVEAASRLYRPGRCAYCNGALVAVRAYSK